MPCPICKKSRHLRLHAYELSEFCFYLDNTSIYEKNNRRTNQKVSVTAETDVVGKWLRLGADLNSIDVAFESHQSISAFACDTHYEMLEDESRLISEYSTAITRFIYVCNAMEELYRFVERHYSGGNLNDASVKCCKILSNLKTSSYPNNFSHFCNNFDIKFKRFINRNGIDLNEEESGVGRYLHSVRELRNLMLHGKFPLSVAYDIPQDSNSSSFEMITLLNSAIRVQLLVTQALLFEFNNGINSRKYHDLNIMIQEEQDSDLSSFGVDYLRHLHEESDFSLSSIEW